MALLPHHQEMLILPHDAEIVCGKLMHFTRQISQDGAEETQNHHQFNGWVGIDLRFRISRKTKHPEHFMPMIDGIIEPTSLGCIVFLRYSLFYSTAFIFWAWILLTGSSTLFFALVFQQMEFAALAALAGLLYYSLLMVNFKMQLKKDQETLHALFNSF